MNRNRENGIWAMEQAKAATKRNELAEARKFEQLGWDYLNAARYGN